MALGMDPEGSQPLLLGLVQLVLLVSCSLEQEPII